MKKEERYSLAYIIIEDILPELEERYRDENAEFAPGERLTIDHLIGYADCLYQESLENLTKEERNMFESKITGTAFNRYLKKENLIRQDESFRDYFGRIRAEAIEIPKTRNGSTGFSLGAPDNPYKAYKGRGIRQSHHS